MISCESARERLGSWLDGEDRAFDGDSMRRHLEQCEACAEERRRLERLDAVLKKVVAAQATDIAFAPFWRGVQRRILEPRSWRVEAWEWLQGTFTPPRLAWLVPAAIVILLGLFSLDSVVPVWKNEARNSFAAVESIDAHGRNVALFRDSETKTTVIWLYQNQEGEDESGETTQQGPSF